MCLHRLQPSDDTQPNADADADADGGDGDDTDGDADADADGGNGDAAVVTQHQVMPGWLPSIELLPSAIARVNCKVNGMKRGELSTHSSA